MARRRRISTRDNIQQILQRLAVNKSVGQRTQLLVQMPADLRLAGANDERHLIGKQPIAFNALRQGADKVLDVGLERAERHRRRYRVHDERAATQHQTRRHAQFDVDGTHVERSVSEHVTVARRPADGVGEIPAGPQLSVVEVEIHTHKHHVEVDAAHHKCVQIGYEHIQHIALRTVE